MAGNNGGPWAGQAATVVAIMEMVTAAMVDGPVATEMGHKSLRSMRSSEKAKSNCAS
jgi:hypothetical protein